MIEFVKKYGGNVYSQNGEDGLIKECLRRIRPVIKVCVEFGGHDGYFCSNTRALIEQGWKGYMYDIAPGHPDVEKKEITEYNVNDLPQCSVLSIDCDGPDYEIWKAYTGKPSIVVIEINSSYAPGDRVYGQGTSYTPMVELGRSKGYFLLCHTGNLVFVDNKYRKLFPEIEGDGLSNSEKYFNRSWL